MVNPKLNRPTFHVGSTVPVDYFVDRIQPTDDAIKFLTQRKGNVLIVGERKIGKTSFVSKLRREMERNHALCVDVNLISYDEDPGAFLKGILLLLCYEVGEKIFKKSASDLLFALGNSATVLTGNFGRFFQIYSLARTMSVSKRRRTSLGGTVKIPALAETEGGLETESQLEIGGVHPLEFIELARELMDICRKYKYESIIIFADEANRLAAQTSKEILRSYFDVFSSRNIQFVFVADISLIDYKPIENIFELTIKLTHFPDIHCIEELLGRYYREQLGQEYTQYFSDAAIGKIWELSRGHPYLVQVLCDGSVTGAMASNRVKILVEDVMQAWVKALEEDRKIIKLWD